MKKSFFMAYLSLFFHATALLLCLPILARNNIDHLALMGIKSSITHDPQQVLHTWNTSLHYCQWQGVECGRRHSRITILDLESRAIVGTLSPYIGNLSFLRVIRLSNNAFTGVIPPQIGALFRLQELILINNSFTGEIPANLSNCIKLTFLGLARNKLTGNLPKQLASLVNLIIISLHNNRFTGEIPSFLGNFTSLEIISAANNHLDGTIPSSICFMNNLMALDMSNNNFVEVLPLCLGNISSSLLMVDMGNNHFHGTIPNVYKCGQLEGLILNGNRLQGEVPRSLSKCQSLKVLDLGNNHFHGTIPNVYKCGQLEGLILNGNRLQGEVPRSLSKCQSLKVLDLGNNQLNGTFPHWSGDLPELQVLVLKTNKLHGAIETTSTNKSLFPGMRVLDLSHNEFKGHLPQKYLQNFNAMKNVVKTSTTPRYVDVGIRYYSITTMVKGMELVFPKISVDYVIVDLSNNRFEGEIPGVISCLASLKVLDLSNNSLTGQIPSVLGNLLEIESLDLSWNQLTGEIPRSLADLTFLAFLNLSQNHLVGHIPSGTQFSTFEASFGGNPELCGLPLPKKCEHPLKPQLEVDGGGDTDGESGFTWRVVMLGYECGTILGLVMGYVMLSTRKPKWFNAIADAGENMIQPRQNTRRYVYIRK